MRREAKYAFVGGVVILSGAIVWVVLNNRESEPLANLPRDLTSGVGPTEALAAPGSTPSQPRNAQPAGASPERHSERLVGNGLAPTPSTPAATLGAQPRANSENDTPYSSDHVLLPRVPQLVAQDNALARPGENPAADTGQTPPSNDAPKAAQADPPPETATLASDVAVPPRDPDATPTHTPTAAQYAVRAGDTLSSIAEEHYGHARHWPRIAAANPGINPNLLKAGQSLVLPPLQSPRNAGATPERPAGSAAGTGAPPDTSPATATYTVAEGDTLTSIARAVLKDGGRWRELYELNRDKLSSPDVVIPGTVLKLPQPKPARGPEHG